MLGHVRGFCAHTHTHTHPPHAAHAQADSEDTTRTHTTRTHCTPHTHTAHHTHVVHTRAHTGTTLSRAPHATHTAQTAHTEHHTQATRVCAHAHTQQVHVRTRTRSLHTHAPTSDSVGSSEVRWRLWVPVRPRPSPSVPVSSSPWVALSCHCLAFTAAWLHTVASVRWALQAAVAVPSRAVTGRVHGASGGKGPAQGRPQVDVTMLGWAPGDRRGDRRNHSP